EENHADERVEGFARGEVQHREEDPEEQERRTDVLPEDHHQHRHAPHGDDRHEVRHRWHGKGSDPARRLRQYLAVLLEICREEDDEEQLHRLPRLDAARPDLDPDPRAVDLAADQRKERREQEGQMDRRHDAGGRAEGRGLGADDRDESGDGERSDPDQQGQLRETCPGAGGHSPPSSDHCSKRSATRPIASSSPYWSRSRARTSSPLMTVPLVLPASSIHHSPSANSRSACFADAASSLITTSLPASRPIELMARSGRRSPTRAAPRMLRCTTRWAMPEGRAATTVSVTRERWSAPNARIRKR